MLDPDQVTLRQQAERGDQDAVDQLVELAGERGDLDELRKLADRGSSDAVDILVELAGERGDRRCQRQHRTLIRQKATTTEPANGARTSTILRPSYGDTFGRTVSASCRSG